MKIYIKEVAKAHGVALQDLASRLGVTRQTLYYYCEQGDRNPVGQLEKIADAIGVPVTELFRDPAGARDGGKDELIAFVKDGEKVLPFFGMDALREFVETKSAPGDGDVRPEE